MSFEQAWAGRNDLVVDGNTIGFLGKADYIRSKRAAGRPKDLLTLPCLKRLDCLMMRNEAATCR